MTLFESGSHYLAQGGPQLVTILLPRPPKCWDYRGTTQHQTFFLFETRFNCVVQAVLKLVVILLPQPSLGTLWDPCLR